METRKNIDLRHLPVWLQYTISTTVVLGIVVGAWLVDQGKTVPDWIREYLVPALGWIFLILFVWAAINRIIKISNK